MHCCQRSGPQMLSICLFDVQYGVHILSPTFFSSYCAFSSQGKEYVFVANSDNLGAIVDLSILG